MIAILHELLRAYNNITGVPLLLTLKDTFFSPADGMHSLETVTQFWWAHNWKTEIGRLFSIRSVIWMLALESISEVIQHSW